MIQKISLLEETNWFNKLEIVFSDWKQYLHSSCLKSVPCKSVLYCDSPDEARNTATTTNQTIIRNCHTKGTIGKNNVDIICPTARDPSSINSIAMLILFLKKITMIKMIRSTMAPIIRNTIQVTKIKGLKGIVYFEFNQSEQYDITMWQFQKWLIITWQLKVCIEVGCESNAD